MTAPRSRWVALVGTLTHERRVAHTDGFPLDESKMLPVPDVVLVVPDERDGDGAGAMLFRYTAFGEFGGDTWHGSVGDAQEQAMFEYGDALIAWLEVPPEVTDAHGYAVRYAHERLDKRGNW
jgi:hypothetical protein